MGRRYALVLAGLALLGVTACGNTGGVTVAEATQTTTVSSAPPVVKRIDSMDNACQALTAQEVNQALGGQRY